MKKLFLKQKKVYNSRVFPAFMMVVVLCITGCPKTQFPPIQQPFPEIPDLDTARVSALVTERAETFHSLRGEGKIAIKNWEEHYKFSEAFVLETPERFRLETLGFLDQPVVFFTSDDRLLSLYSKKHNTFYHGVASQENLFRLSGINLSVDDMIRVLTGNPPQLAPINVEWGIAFPELQQFYLERISIDNNTLQRILFDTQLRNIIGVEEYRLTDGELTLRVVFHDYRAETGSYPIPAEIQIERPFDKVRVDITYHSFVVNQGIEQDLFKFTPPSNAKKVFIDNQFSEEELQRLAPFEEFRVKEKASFKLTKQSLKRLKEEELPDNILKDLEQLVDRGFEEENQFLNAVEKQIGKEQTVRYKELILKYAKERIEPDNPS